ncbi:MAG: S-layer homology domain-containing protein, partial [Oscillospiraceae bacterium]|nr:S-layer homology domain-containing protein [Oscillospiraceae bacterium]
IWYVPENGTPEKMSTIYRNGNLEVRVSHFSEYVIAYDEADAVGYANCGRDAACPLSVYADLIPTAWYHDGVHYCLNTGLMNGVGDGKFNPTGTTSRAMVVTMLWRMAGSPKATENSTFTDVPTGTWYTEAAAWGAENGIINGYNGAFDPGGAITREQLAAMLYRYAKTQGKGFTGMWMMQLDYPDADSVSTWAEEAMSWMTMTGVINGKDGKLVPTGAASRAEAAAMLQRFCRAIEK